MRYIQAMCYLLKFILVKLENSNNVVIRGFGRCKLSSKIKVRKNGKIILEDNVRVTEGCKLLSDGGKIIIGRNTGINRNSVISSHDSIEIGSDCLLAPNVCIYDHDHLFDYGGLKDGYSVGKVVIGNNCWIGTNVIILKNTTIGDGCVVGAGTVVHGNIPSHTIVKNNRDIELIPIKK